MDIFTKLLSLLNVKYTKSFSEKLYDEHPYKYTLYGISQMLSDYNIPNVGLRLKDKDELLSIQTPFISQITDDFVIVTKTEVDYVEYTWRGKNVRVSMDNLNDLWTGIVLVAEPNEESGEPDYVKHIQKERFILAKRFIILTTTLFLIYFSISGTVDIYFSYTE